MSDFYRVHIILKKTRWIKALLTLIALFPYRACLTTALFLSLISASAQQVEVPDTIAKTIHDSVIKTTVPDSVIKAVPDTLVKNIDEFELAPLDSLITDEAVRQLQEQSESIAKELELQGGNVDTTAKTGLLPPRLSKQQRDWDTWIPNPQRAMWLAMVIPGAGQMYNRKYWKLPLFYGGFMGCIYALTWNNKMYKEYAQAYLDIMDDDPGTHSYMNFMTLGRRITPQNEERYKNLFKRRKDRYRRWRDMSFFVMCGVYALSVIDAYVDAELSVFDISSDLSMKVEPAVMGSPISNNPLQASSLGVNCKINF